jgi:hypothetical protein
MMNAQKYVSKKLRRGSVLGVVIVIGMCLALLGWGMLEMGLGARVNCAISVSQITAREAADAGLTHALYRMNAALNFNGSIDPATFPATSVLHTVAMDSANTNAVYQLSQFIAGVPYPYYVVTSTGRVNDEARRIQTVHSVTRRVPYWFGVGVKEDFVLNNGGVIGTYPFGSTFTGSIRTNSIGNDAITVHSGTHIPGDLIIGPSGDVDYAVKIPSGNATIDGSMYPADSKLSFPDAELPVLPWVQGPSLTYDTVTTPDGHTVSRAVLPAGAYYYDNLSIAFVEGTEWTELVILGDVYLNVIHDMRIGNGTRVVIGDQDAAFEDSLELYLGKPISSGSSDSASLVAENGSTIMTLPYTAGMDPNCLDLQIYGLPSCTSGPTSASASITLHNSSEFWGVVYAPDAILDIHNSGTMYGSFLGKSMNINNSGEFYYDTRLAGPQVEGPLFFEIERWWEDNQHLALPTS